MHPTILSFLFLFGCSLCLTLVMVPLFSRIAASLGIVDIPNGRKVHTKPIPRIGGVAIFISFYVTLILAAMLFADTGDFPLVNLRRILLVLGSVVAFAVGLADDMHRLTPWQKLVMQLVSAGLAYLGGIRIESIGFYALFQVDLGWLSPLVTLFWVVLVINAFNLIDGLDGLAGGVGLIAAAILAYVCFLHNYERGIEYMVVIAGCLFGFLRYNYHPASIFMGDGGSYFLGYVLGTTSILAAMPNPTTMTILVPMLAVALPVIDVSMAIIRRFIRGQAIFKADNRHFHHMLLSTGLSHRRAVLVLYGITLFISICSLALLKFRDERALFLLFLLGCTFLYGLIRLGYFRGYDAKAVLPWIMEVGDGLGLSRSRRTFFNLQLKIGTADSLDGLFHHLQAAVNYLDISVCALYLTPRYSEDGLAGRESGACAEDQRQQTPLYASVTHRQVQPVWVWHNPQHTMEQLHRRLFRVEMDLYNEKGRNFGALVMLKNQAEAPISLYTLNRIEHLRRSILKALEKINQTTRQVD
ncbi:undecaprenyl/decaprenyl-phosphate alpha-N-acetylglucosaminyl 1-phosphate transferase [Desulfobulbus rhabdoformis]|uniref:glycosyltransferase family 4 protein n=1 Tax=Desulfobulbus rhabdoformis TaxID=34032 RepID=UPI001965158D|nr:MraY family glycosyltransferase [Desulfobulbus rhabdoformis]MBM9612685.1 undecaprenyl/decaprenyl-phosphate alpha-N-acetylglucosaminyl 1-phosphate transferase [Desulfobulbus rhabdoformis]